MIGIGKSRESFFHQVFYISNTEEIEDQASEWFDIVNKAIENDRYAHQTERGPIVEFRILILSV